MKKVFTLLFICIMFTGCDDTDEGILCATGPVGLTFEVVDKETGKNLFANGSYEENQLTIVDKKGEAVEFSFLAEREVLNVLLGWGSKSDTYTVNIGEEITFTIAFTLQESSSGDCTSTGLTALEIEGATFEISENSEVATILVSAGGS
jgi:hypothetical protein